MVPYVLYTIALNLVVLEKDNTICAALVNTTMCLNLFGEPKVVH